jgi:hypothetical protein
MPLLPRFRWHLLAAVVVALAAAECPGIEMFTYYGDGSRIGLPSLEVPIEAYPGIPLRSDRIRARRRAIRMGPAGAVRIGPPGYARGITIRTMPPVKQAAPAPVAQSMPIPPEPEIGLSEPETASADRPESKKIRGEAETIPAPASER